MIEYLARCRRLADVPKDADVVSVDGKSVVAKCECCGGFVYEGTQYTSWSDGPYTHKSCHRFSKEGEG